MDEECSTIPGNNGMPGSGAEAGLGMGIAAASSSATSTSVHQQAADTQKEADDGSSRMEEESVPNTNNNNNTNTNGDKCLLASTSTSNGGSSLLPEAKSPLHCLKTEQEMAATTTTMSSKRCNSFICGVIEGFYGRPWTTEQRKDLFRKLKKWGMDSYVYAPKDDYKHRAYWRELYTVEEADHLTGLIVAAKEQGITFYYALSPGLDMCYSSQKELQTLKRKLDQVSQFGCEAFALLFDDIEPELSKTDKEVFQTFGNAQVSVTNEISTHLGNPRFLFCPTQYCSSRAVPSVHDSEYLNTLGSKLNHDIDIMWTGNKVISKTLTLESIQEITEVLRRPPVIWDNLHANDYDQKRVFLGPYSGRSPELIPHLRGVMTNPNCEFHANTIAIHTLAYWSRCNLDSKVNSSLSADIKLETENDDGTSGDNLPENCCLSKNIYHPRIALKNAIYEWLPEFFIAKEAWGPIMKPQPQVTMVMPIIPIIPSINTCMSLTTTTTTSTNAKTVTVPEVNTTQLQALADVCCSSVNTSAVNPIMNPVMNSLVSPTKVVTNDDIVNPIPTCVASNIELPKKIPISIVSVPIMHTKTGGSDGGCDEDTELPFPTSLSLAAKHSESLLTKSKSHGLLDDEEVEEEVMKDDDEEFTQETIENAAASSSSSSAAAATMLLNTINTQQQQQQNTSVVAASSSNVINPNNKLIVEEEEGEDIPIDENNPTSSNNNNTDVNTANSNNNILMSPEMGQNHPTAMHSVLGEENNLSPLSPSTTNEPMECSSSLASQTSPQEEEELTTTSKLMVTTGQSEDVIMAETPFPDDTNNTMQIESVAPSPLSNVEDLMPEEEEENIDKHETTPRPSSPVIKINADDLHLLCDLFYLPFEHGSRGFKLLNEFNWLKANAYVLLEMKNNKRAKNHSVTSAMETATSTSISSFKPNLSNNSNTNNNNKNTIGNSNNNNNGPQLELGHHPHPHPHHVNSLLPKPEVAEWLHRAESFSSLCASVEDLLRKVATCDNKEICHDLFSYVWDITGALSLLNAFVKWLRLGHFPSNVYSFTQGTYTWFSKGWKEAFMSGDQEPWVFRGGLIADLQRLMPVDSGNDLFLYKLPELPTTDYHVMRPYTFLDEMSVNRVCTEHFLALTTSARNLLNSIEESSSSAQKMMMSSGDKIHSTTLSSITTSTSTTTTTAITEESVRDLIADYVIGPFICLQPEFCIVATDSSGSITGFAAAAYDYNIFSRNALICWIPEMCMKYPLSLSTDATITNSFSNSEQLNRIMASMINEFHHYEPQCPSEVSNMYPAVMTMAVLDTALSLDNGIAKRLITVLLATLRANGCFGVHVRLPSKDVGLQLIQYYMKLGFAEIYRDGDNSIYFGRRF